MVTVADPHPGLVAFNRFGMGARPGDLARIGSDPRGALKAELARPDVAMIGPDDVASFGLMSTAPSLQAAFSAGEARRLQAQQKATAELSSRAHLSGIGSDDVAAQAAAKPVPAVEQKIYRAEALARFAKVASAEIGFVERLVAFWSNHFCVGTNKSNLIAASAGSFEREAIRPNVLGSFLDMLMAVERHPAMLIFLDNAQSFGPDSLAGQRQKRGLNENLAREIMELHTLGVDSGYAQADVTSLARVLTGWSYVGRDGRLGEPGAFAFNIRAHQPGDEMVIGRAYLQGGVGQGETALTDLARHPATAHHIATKLARHLMADDPPPAAVDRLARVFRERDGDLRAIASTLVDMPESWATPLAKLRNPYDISIAATRLLGPVPAGAAPSDPGPILGTLRGLGMPLWEPPGPNGFPDTAAAWGSPEGMKLRLDLAAQVAHGAKTTVEPPMLLDAMAGQGASEETRLAVARAESREQAIAILLMSPEFQRR